MQLTLLTHTLKTCLPLCLAAFLSCKLPEVKLELAHGSKRSSSHMLEASLTAEGARFFKVDGRLKSGSQVKVGRLAELAQATACGRNFESLCTSACS